MSAKEYGTPGPRSIYPEICDSRSLARCGLVANALWPRLLVRCDDQGRMAGDAGDVLGECFPKMLKRIRLRDVETALAELEAAEMIVRYVAEGDCYLQVVAWWTWQSYGRRAYPSRLPNPDGWSDVVYGLPDYPATYREAVGIEPRKRSRDDADAGATTADHEGNSTSGTARQPHANRTGTARQPQGAGTGTAPEPHRAALARAGGRGGGPVPSRPVLDSVNGEEVVVPPREPSNGNGGFHVAGDVLSQLLTVEQAKAWGTFGSEWDETKRAWIGKGLRFPPAGDADDEPGAEHPSQRAMLYEVLRDHPGDLPSWIRDCRERTAHEVIAYVLTRWHDVRDAVQELGF